LSTRVLHVSDLHFGARKALHEPEIERAIAELGVDGGFELRQAVPWVAEGSVTVQQQALRDFAQAWSNFFAGTHHRPTWRRKGTHEGFRIVALFDADPAKAGQRIEGRPVHPPEEMAAVVAATRAELVCLDDPTDRYDNSEPVTAKVRALAASGAPHDDIAKVVGCSAKTLRKHFRRELDCAAIEMNAQVAGYLFANARGGNFQAQKFWLEHRAGWRIRSECRQPLPKPKLVQPPKPLQIAGIIRSGSDAKL